MIRSLFSIAALLAIAACAPMEPTLSDGPGDAVPREVSAPPPPASARTVEEFDTTSAADRIEAADSTEGGRLLGTDVASLGDPSEPGFWIASTLVTEAGRGRVVLAGTDTAVEVDLIPGTGGSRLSLPAMRVLGVGLTDLPEVEIYAF